MTSIGEINNGTPQVLYSMVGLNVKTFVADFHQKSKECYGNVLLGTEHPKAKWQIHLILYF